MKSAWEGLKENLPGALTITCPDRFNLEGKYRGTEECVLNEDRIFNFEKCYKCWTEVKTVI